MAATASTTNNDQTLVANDLDGPSTDLDNDLEMMAKLKFTMNKLKRLQMMLVHRNKKVEIISHQNSILKLKLTRTDPYCNAVNLKKKDPLNELPHTPVSSASSSADRVDSNLEDLNSAEPLTTQVVESKNLPNSQGGSVVLGPSLDQLEPNPEKQHKTKNTSTRPRNLGKMREFTVVTENGGYYTCLGDSDPNEDRDVCYRKQDLEVCCGPSSSKTQKDPEKKPSYNCAKRKSEKALFLKRLKGNISETLNDLKSSKDNIVLNPLMKN